MLTFFIIDVKFITMFIYTGTNTVYNNNIYNPICNTLPQVGPKNVKNLNHFNEAKCFDEGRMFTLSTFSIPVTVVDATKCFTHSCKESFSYKVY